MGAAVAGAGAGSVGGASAGERMPQPPAATQTNAVRLDVEHEPVPDGQRVAGHPSTAVVEFEPFAGTDVGVWEMSVGTMSDVEADEVFVVLSGAASVEFVDSGQRLELAPGDVVRLHAGQRTEWTVTETLRKVYFAG